MTTNVTITEQVIAATISESGDITATITETPITTIISGYAVSSTGEYIPEQPMTSATIQAAIDAAYAAGGGVVFLPAGTITLTASLVPKRGVTIRGIYPGATSSSPISWDLGFNVDTGTILTYPGGTVFQQDTSGGIGTLSSLNGVIIECLGFHDIGSIISCGAENKSGLDGSVLRNLIASNVSGIALDLTNILQCNVSNIRAECKQLLRVTCNYDPAVAGHAPGNTYFTDLYSYITDDGYNVPSVHLRVIYHAGSPQYLNFCHFDRLQVNRHTRTAEAGGSHIKIEGNTNGQVNGCTFNGLDLEGTADYNVDVYKMVKSSFYFVETTSNSDAVMKIRSSDTIIINSAAYDFDIDMDSTAQGIFLNGLIEGVTSGSYSPLGVYIDRSISTTKAQVVTDEVPNTGLVPSYDNDDGQGDRTATITVTTSGASPMWGSLDGVLSKLVNGYVGAETGMYPNNGVNVADEWIQFEFAESKLITEITTYFNNVFNCGVWQTQGWNGSSWVNIGAQFTLGAWKRQIISLADNSTGYTKYRWLGISGTSSWDNNWQEVEFKIAS